MSNHDETKYCPFCGEEIKKVAIKCKHCGEWLDKSRNKITPQRKGNTGNRKDKSVKEDDKIFGISSDGCSFIIICVIYFPLVFWLGSAFEFSFMTKFVTALIFIGLTMGYMPKKK